MTHVPVPWKLGATCCLISMLVASAVFARGREKDTTAQDEVRKQVEAILTGNAKEKLRALGRPAIPHLIAIYEEGRHRKEILPLLVDSRTREARQAVEKALLTEVNNDEIYMMALALGTINQPASKPVLVKKLQSLPKVEPNLAGISFGGSSDVAHFGLIWALSRVEGENFGLPEDHTWKGEDVARCLEWWKENRAKFGIK